jgi:hypothetical protein
MESCAQHHKSGLNEVAVFVRAVRAEAADEGSERPYFALGAADCVLTGGVHGPPNPRAASRRNADSVKVFLSERVWDVGSPNKPVRTARLPQLGRAVRPGLLRLPEVFGLTPRDVKGHLLEFMQPPSLLVQNLGARSEQRVVASNSSIEGDVDQRAQRRDVESNILEFLGRIAHRKPSFLTAARPLKLRRSA